MRALLIQALELILGSMQNLIELVFVNSHLKFRLKVLLELLHHIGLLPNLHHFLSIITLLVIVLEAWSCHFTQIATRRIMGALHVAFVAPPSQELVIFLLFLSRLVFLVSSCAGHLFGKFGCDKPVLSDNSVPRLLFAHFIDTWVTLVAGDVGHLPVHLGPDFFVCGLLLVIMVVVLLQLPQLSSAFRVFAVLAAVKLIVQTASLLRLMLLFHDF